MRHILSITAQDNPGVLQRLTGLLRRKCFNIASLTAGKTNLQGVSRLTIVISGDEENAQKAALQINKFIEVLSVKIIPKENSLVREIVLVKFRVENSAQKYFLEYFEKLIQALGENMLHKKISQKILGKDPQKTSEIVFEIIDHSQNLSDFLTQLKQDELNAQKNPKTRFEIATWVQSGIIAMEK